MDIPFPSLVIVSVRSSATVSIKPESTKPVPWEAGLGDL